MPIYTWRVSTYARDIYLFGNRTLNDVPNDYVEPIKLYSAQTFALRQLDEALANGYITQTEYNETVAYI